jgi:putative ABC transport system permease protein
MLALKELLGSKLKFGLIALVIGLVVSLTMLMSAMSEGLVTGMTGAEGSLDADALVFQGDTQLQLERSRLSADDVAAVSSAAAVAGAYPIGHGTMSVRVGDEAFDARVFGLGDRFGQLPIVEGRGGVPGPGQAIVDVTAKAEGIEVGDTVALSPTGRELTVIGFTENRRFVMAPAFFVDMATWEDLYLASTVGSGSGDGEDASATTVADGTTDMSPDASTQAGADLSTGAAGYTGSASVVAVALVEGAYPEDLAAELGGRFEVVTPEDAALSGNGMPVMVLAVNAIQVVSLVIGALLIGVFFYITTLHKTVQLAAVKALGGSNVYLARQLLLQITVLVTIAAAFGTLLALGAGASMPPTMAFDPGVDRWLLTLAAVYAMAYLGSLFSLRSITAIDAATALDQAEH